MICPNCKASMVTKSDDSIHMDVCPNCAGTWFDGQELTRMKDHILPDANWLDFNLWKDVETMSYSLGERPCPICEKVMAQMAYGDTGVTVDACIQKHGVFLETGEFEMILKALEDEITAKNAPEYLRETLKEGRELIAGTEGSQHDWKDFTTVVRLFSQRFLVEHPTIARALAEFDLASPK